MSPTAVPDRFTTLPDENTWQATAVALEEHGFSGEIAGDLDAARQAVITSTAMIIRDRTLVIAPASDRQLARTAGIMVGE